MSYKLGKNLLDWKMFFYSAATLLAAFSVSWLLLMKVDFLYGVWHDIGGIAEGIEKYGPENRFKRGFADTSREQRIDIFAEINFAVHNGGDGLSRITYESPSSSGTQTLLREPEVVHLQDVANLIDVLKPIPLASFFLWLVCCVVYLYKSWPAPSVKRQSTALLSLLGFALVLLLAIGAENVFNTLHVWVFPDGHQWFFYYQDSLMSTMMLAPVLFGWIAAAIVVVALLAYVGLNLIHWWVARLWRAKFKLPH